MSRDRPTIDRNGALTDGFVRSLGVGKDSPPRPGPGDKKAVGTLWTGIAGRDIAEYLRNLTFPPESVQVDGSKLAAYITDQLAIKELSDWTVYLATVGEKEVENAGRRR